jgi:hypothetical protein
MATKKRETKNYALIYFRDKKPLKKPYDTVSKAFYDYEDKGCVLVELFNERGTLLASRKPSAK